MARTKVISSEKGDTKKQKKQKLTVARENTTTNTTTAAAIPGTTAKRATPRKRIKQTDTESAPMTADERHRKIAMAAYYRAEKRGFQCRCSEQDWFDAAAEVDSMT